MHLYRKLAYTYDNQVFVYQGLLISIFDFLGTLCQFMPSPHPTLANNQSLS